MKEILDRNIDLHPNGTITPVVVVKQVEFVERVFERVEIVEVRSSSEAMTPKLGRPKIPVKELTRRCSYLKKQLIVLLV